MHPKCDTCEKTEFPGQQIGEGFACFNCAPQLPGEFRDELDKRGLFSHMVWEKGFDATITFFNTNGERLTATNIGQTPKLSWRIEDAQGVALWFGGFFAPNLINYLAGRARAIGRVKKIQL